MTDHPNDQTDQRPGRFGDSAGLSDQTSEAAGSEVPPSAAAPRPEAAAPVTDVDADISGVDNWLEEGGPLEPGDEGVAAEVATLRAQLAERTLDLQRLQAEYVNYKRRVDRDRELVKQNATYTALAPITEVLDTIDRAREHGELEGGLKSVAEQLERTVAAQGLTKFGAPGEPFDPQLHEALSTVGEDAEVSVSTVKVVARSGYRIGDRVVRAAQVLTVEPA